MRIVKIILVGMLLAAVILPLPGHTAANSSPPAPPSAPQAEAAPAAGTPNTTDRVGDSNPPQPAPPPAPAPETAAPQPAAPQPSVTPTAAPPVSAAPAGELTAKPIEVVMNGELKLKLNFQDTPLQTVLEYDQQRRA